MVTEIYTPFCSTYKRTVKQLAKQTGRTETYIRNVIRRNYIHWKDWKGYGHISDTQNLKEHIPTHVTEDVYQELIKTCTKNRKK